MVAVIFRNMIAKILVDILYAYDANHSNFNFLIEKE